MNWLNPDTIRLIETIVIKIDRSCLLIVQGSTIEIYNRSCLIDPVTILVMCQLSFGFIHNLTRLLYSYYDNPVRFASITMCLRFVPFSIGYQNNFITDGFDLLRNDYDSVSYDFIYPIYDYNQNRVFLSLYSVNDVDPI